MHFGGDEVHSYRCWDTSPVVQAWAAQKGLRNSSEIRNFFQQQLQLVARKNGASAVFWQEVYDGGNALANSSVVDIWLDNERLAQVLRAGHRAVQSFGYYLDRQVPSGNQTHYFWQCAWRPRGAGAEGSATRAPCMFSGLWQTPSSTSSSTTRCSGRP